MSPTLWRRPAVLQALKQTRVPHQGGTSFFFVFAQSRFAGGTAATWTAPLHSRVCFGDFLRQQKRFASTHGGGRDSFERGSAAKREDNGEEPKNKDGEQGKTEKEAEGSAADLSEEEYANRVFDQCDYKDENLLVRLGFSPYEFVDEAKVKRHFFILAKRYHPDLPDAPPNASEAFQRIREAHDLAIRHIRDRGPFHEGEVHYFYADEVKRRIMVKALGAGVFFFLFATVFFIVVVCRHNSSRLDAMMLFNFVIIFMTLQLFPKLLAAAVLFAWQSSHYVKAKELQEQANVVVLAEKERGHLSFAVQGVSPSYADGAVVQVTAMKPQPGETAVDATAAAATPATTLTYGKGVLKASVPLEKKGTQYRIKVTHDATQLVLFDQLLTV